ncbi:ATP-binding protein [Streptomyces sp. NPDC087658]
MAEPGAGNLAYGLTLPSAVATPGIAFWATESIFGAHGVAEELIEPYLLLVHELAAYACLFTGAGEQIQLTLCRPEGTDPVQVMVYDTHPPHRHRLLAGLCDERRRTTLTGVPDLVETHRGTWGFGPAHHPAAGTGTWATLAQAAPTVTT